MSDPTEPLAPRWTRPAATELHNIADVLGHPGRTVPNSDHWDDRPFVEWQAAAIQKVMHDVIDTAWRAGVAEGRRQAGSEQERTEDRPPQCPATRTNGERCHANKGHQGTHVRFNEANGLLAAWDTEELEGQNHG